MSSKDSQIYKDQSRSLSESYKAKLWVALQQRKQSANLQEILDLLPRSPAICQEFRGKDEILFKSCNKCLEDPRRNPALVKIVAGYQQLLYTPSGPITEIFLNKIKEWLYQCLKP